MSRPLFSWVASQYAYPVVAGALLQRVGVETGVRGLRDVNGKVTKRDMGKYPKGVPTLALIEMNPSGSQATPRGGVGVRLRCPI